MQRPGATTPPTKPTLAPPARMCSPSATPITPPPQSPSSPHPADALPVPSQFDAQTAASTPDAAPVTSSQQPPLSLSSPLPSYSPVAAHPLPSPPISAPPPPLSLSYTPLTWSPVQTPLPTPLQRTPDASPPASPRGFHLTPITWEDLQNFQPPSDQRYEIINGLCVAMASERRRHNMAVSLLGQLILLFCGFDVYFVPSHQIKFNILHDNDTNKPCMRIPDMSIVTRHLSSYSVSEVPSPTPPQSPTQENTRRSSSSPTSSCSTAQRLRKAEKTMRFALSGVADVVLEYTSTSTRVVDLTEKWVEYALSGIPIYIIVDADDVSPDGKARVIIGHLNPTLNQGSSRHLHAFPSGSALPSLTQFRDTAMQYKDHLYYKTEFVDDDRVTFAFLRKLRLTAAQMQSPTTLQHSLRLAWRRRELSPAEIEECMYSIEHVARLVHSHAEELSRMQSERDRAISERDNEKMGRENAERGREEEKRGREEERMGREDAELLLEEERRKSKALEDALFRERGRRKSKEDRGMNHLGSRFRNGPNATSRYARSSSSSSLQRHSWAEDRHSNSVSDFRQSRSRSPRRTASKSPPRRTEGMVGSSTKRRAASRTHRHEARVRDGDSSADVVSRKRGASPRRGRTGSSNSPGNSPPLQRSRIGRFFDWMSGKTSR